MVCDLESATFEEQAVWRIGRAPTPWTLVTRPVSWLRSSVVGQGTVTARCAQVGHSRSLACLHRELAPLVVRYQLEGLDDTAG